MKRQLLLFLVYLSCLSSDAFSQSDQSPQLETRLSSAFPIEMPELYAYPLYASVRNEPDSVTISSLTFSIQGEIRNAEKIGDGGYRLWWIPAQYGTFEIITRAEATNGKVSSDTVILEVTTPVANRQVTTFSGALINFPDPGRVVTSSFSLPQFTGSYSKIIGSFSVTCPSISGGCDDWDRLAHVEILAPNGQWVEIIRYITPYGIGCEHTIDLTDYASLLQGNVTMRVRIDTWGTGGWNVNLDLEYEKGTPDFIYTTVDRIWQGSFPFGNFSNLDPVPDQNVTWPSNTERAVLKLVTTGHGWGENNTSNAAEFYQSANFLYTDGALKSAHFFWTNCNPNPDGCQPQFGTWQFSRAGWCPGAIGTLKEFDLTDLSAQSSTLLEYRFNPGYRDFCHPNNPDCVSGFTCPNCDDGFNPFYSISANLITSSNSSPIESVVSAEIPADRVDPSLRLEVFPSPSTGLVRLSVNPNLNAGSYLVTIWNISGMLVGTYPFNSPNALNDYEFKLGHLEKGMYFVRVESPDGREGTAKVILQ